MLHCNFIKPKIIFNTKTFHQIYAVNKKKSVFAYPTLRLEIILHEKDTLLQCALFNTLVKMKIVYFKRELQIRYCKVF